MIIRNDGTVFCDGPEDEIRKALAAMGLDPKEYTILPEAEWLASGTGMGPGWPFCSTGHDDDPPEDD